MKRKTPLKRSRKRLNNRRTFKAHGSNSLKVYRRRFTDYQVMLRAEICRQRRLEDRTPAELTFAALLDTLSVHYVKEKILQNGDRWVLIDFFVPVCGLAFEIDGMAHERQKEYDDGRTAFLEEKGIRVIRFTNKEVLKNTDYIAERLSDLLRDYPSPSGLNVERVELVG